MKAEVAAPEKPSPGLARRLGLFNATMIVMGGIVGSGIFMNPYVVARQVRSPALILGVWILGGFIALGGAFVYADLAARRPQVGGQYAYIREAYHPLVAFIFGWALLLVTQTGGMAAVAVTFARYFVKLTRIQAADWLIAALALGALTVINCLGVKAGSTAQSILMVLKIVAIASLVVCGLLLGGTPTSAPPFAGPLLDRPVSFDLLTAVGAAMVPVLFAYGGWQTACFIAGEVREPRKNMPRGLIIGVVGVIALYLGVNFACVRVLGASGLTATTTPATDVMRSALGDTGARLIAAGIAISTLGFLSQSMLTAPRVYYAMAQDGLALGIRGAALVRDNWEQVAFTDAFSGIAFAASRCLPLEEAHRKVADALSKMDIMKRSVAKHVLRWFETQLNLDWIEENVSSPVDSSWGSLAASSKFDWERAKNWLSLGRPLSLVALDALEWCVCSGRKPPLVNPPSSKEFVSILEDYLSKDNVRRVSEKVYELLEFSQTLKDPR